MTKNEARLNGKYVKYVIKKDTAVLVQGGDGDGDCN